ncbi:MAG TPA: AAA family ATPase [Planctomycetota bacterium]|nr:AAA family ATPase [Planctomycetota bacterium]
MKLNKIKPDPWLSPVLGADNRTEHLKQRAFIQALAGFVPKSESKGWLTLEPEVTSDRILSLLGSYSIVWSEGNDVYEELILQGRLHAVLASVRPGHLSLDVFSRKPDARAVLQALRKRLKPLRFRNQEEGGVWAQFSYLSSNGVETETQFLRCPLWDEIRLNYALSARVGLERLLALEMPWKRGRLIIWHGPPGAGKTYALRALMRFWRKTFDFVVVNDPENLARDPGYYYHVASASSERPRFSRSDPDPDPDSKEGSSSPDGRDKRRVFILEDTADLILEESRASHFDKIGKLLNMTDGLFGQGREDVFLLTFNEDVHRIDPAFLRPGRCIAKVEFPKFTPAEAALWLRARGVQGFESPGDMALAELYAKLLEREEGPAPALPASLTRKLGFSSGRRA